MTTYNLQCTTYLDSSDISIDPSLIFYEKSLLAKGFVESNDITISDVFFERSAIAKSYLDSFSFSVISNKSSALYVSGKVDTSNISVKEYYERNMKASTYTDTFEIDVIPSKERSLEMSTYLDSSNFSIMTNYIRNIGSEIQVEESNFNINSVQRYMMTIPPNGDLILDNLPLKNQKLKRQNNYAIDLYLYGKQISQAGTTILFKVFDKGNTIIDKSTKHRDNSIILQSETLLEDNKKELIYQIQLRTSDMSLFPQSSIDRKYNYEVIVDNSLDEQYVIECGQITISPC